MSPTISRVTILPRSTLVLLLLGAACSRQRYSTSPVPVAKIPEAAATPARVSQPQGDISNVDVVNYIVTRGLGVPVRGVTTAQLHDTFDEGRDGGRVHRALDILAPRGTPVLSADSGRILRISTNTLGGNIIYAQDPLGKIVYYYAHLDAYFPGLTQGANVARGDTLGFVGTTGNAPKDTPHLHFQIMRMPTDGKYWDGDAINPYPLYLLMRPASQP